MADSLFLPSLRPALSQGDILENVRVAEPHLGVGDRTFSAMALSHSCEIDKKRNAVMLVAAVLPVEDFAEMGLDNIRARRVLSVFHLPIDPVYGGVERCVDFRRTFRVAFSAIGATGFARIGDKDQRVFVDADPRVQSLSDYGVLALHGHIVAFYTRTLQ